MFFLFSEMGKDTFYFCTLFRELVVLMVLFQAGLSDISEGRIPNKLLVTGIIFIFPFMVPGSLIKEIENMAGVLLLSLLFLILWCLGLIGGGDVKLIAFMALAKGAEAAAFVIAVSFIAAVLFKLPGHILKGSLYKGLIELFDYIKGCGIEKYRNGGESYVEIAYKKGSALPLAAYMFFSDLLILACSG